MRARVMESEEGLARALWPWLSERLARVGDVVLELERELERGGAAVAALEDARARVEACGWLVGCVAEALGGSPASPRRMPAGLCWMVEALNEAARERGLPPCAPVPPSAQPGVTRAQAWACGRVLWWLAGAAPGRDVRVSSVGEDWAIAGAGAVDESGAKRLGLPGRIVGGAAGWRWIEDTAGVER